MAGKPSFLRDPDQAAELAALLQDIADGLETGGNGEQLSRAELSRHTQTIARYRRWAPELDPKFGDTPEAARPLHIRPARGSVDTTNEEATG